MLRRCTPLATTGFICGIARWDEHGTFSDVPRRYRYKEHQAEQSEPKDSTYLKMDAIFADKPIRYEKRIRYDRAVLAAERDRLAGKVVSALDE
jgi:hypothetical protein